MAKVNLIETIELIGVMRGLKDDISAGDLSWIDDLYAERYWNLKEIIDVLAVYKVIEDEVPNESLALDLLTLRNCYFSTIKEGLSSGEIKTIKRMERKGDHPTSGAVLGPGHKLRSYLRSVGDRISSFSHDDRLLGSFVLGSDLLTYLKEKGINFPAKSSASKESIPTEDATAAEHLPPPCKRERTLDILKQISTSDRTNSGAKALWEPRDEVLSDAIEFMIDTVELGQCECRHDKLASIAYHKGADRNGMPFKDRMERWGLETKFKEAASLIVIPQRRFGCRVDGKSLYDKKACNCAIPSHRSFVDPSRKNAKIPKTT